MPPTHLSLTCDRCWQPNKAATRRSPVTSRRFSRRWLVPFGPLSGMPEVLYPQRRERDFSASTLTIYTVTAFFKRT